MKFLLLLILVGASYGAMAQGAERLDSELQRAPASTPQVGTALDSSDVTVTPDHAPEASPVGPAGAASGKAAGGSLARGTVLRLRLGATVSSGQARNGDAVHGTLAAAVRTSSGAVLPAGTRVTGTVVSSAKAGTVQSGGVLSLQVTHVGPLALVTDVAEFDGKEGHKDLPDSAPAKGSEAVARAGAVLEFHVLENGAVPGIVPGAHAAPDGKGGGSLPGGTPGSTAGSTPLAGQRPVNGGSVAPALSAPGVPR